VLVTADSGLCGNPQGFWWAPDGRLIFSLAESHPQRGTIRISAEVRLNPRTGEPENKAVRMTKLVGFPCLSDSHPRMGSGSRS